MAANEIVTRYVALMRAQGIVTETRQIRLLKKKFPGLETYECLSAIGHIPSVGLWSTANITFPFGKYQNP